MNNRVPPRVPRRRAIACRGMVVTAAISGLLGALSAMAQQVPEGFRAIPERERISAIDEPNAVGATGASIDGDAWIIGVEIADEARAYDLGLLNGHEVVNDRIGNVDFAVVWSPYANAAVVFSRVVDGQTLELEPAAGLLHGATVLQDRDSGSYWSMMSGRAVAGPRAGDRLAVLPVSDRMSWARWVALHPQTELVAGAADAESEAGPDFASLREFYASAEGYDGLMAIGTGLEAKRPVYGFHRAGTAYAADTRRIIGGRGFTLADGSQVLLYREAGDGLARGTAAFVSTAGFEQRGGSWFELATNAEFNAITRDFGGAGVPRLDGFDAFWYSWSLANPATELLR